jgi:hypothetical protein
MTVRRTAARTRSWPPHAATARALLIPVAVTTSFACLQLSPVRVEQPIVGHAPTLEYATIAPEIGPGAEEVNIGVGCLPVPFGVGEVGDLDGETLSYRFFLLFEDPSEGEGVARQELASNQLVPLPSDPTRFQGPIHALGREELSREFRFNALAELVSATPAEKLHELELVIADRPFTGDVDEDVLPEGVGQIRVAWDVYFTDTPCATEDPQ